MSKKIIIAVVAVLLLAVFWSIVRTRGSSAAGGTAAGGRRGGPMPAGAVIPVVATEVVKRDVPIFLDGLGTVQAFNTVTVRARVDGELTKISFTEGQDVKAGDELALIDPRPYQAALDQAIAKKATDEAQLANARTTYARNAELLAKKVLDQQTFDTSKYLVDQFVATVQSDAAAIESAQTQVAYTHIVSPIDGRVGIRQVDQGNIIHAADVNGLVVITQLRPISVVFTLPQQNLVEVNKSAANGTLQVLAVGRDNATPLGDGKLAVVDNQIDPNTGTMKLKATFPNENLSLWPGQFVNTRLLVNTIKDGLVVPASVVQRGPQGSYAYVIKPDMTVEMRPITVNQIDSGVALINQGLAVGETVVVDGQYKLQPGTKVEISGNGEKASVPQLGTTEAPGATPARGQNRKAQNGNKELAAKGPNES
jgi:membrane fusion protein, multidrug efflux system